MMSVIEKQLIGKAVRPDLKRLFSPRSIAHVGASAKRSPGRFNFILYLQNMGYAGELYPVNPNYDEVYGLKCHPSLADVPGEVDMAILALPAPRCAQILREVPAGKLGFVIVHTSGFSEIDKGSLEDELVELGREKGFRIIGPNCMGVFCRESRVCFWDDQQELRDRPGWVGYVSQSGGLTVHVISGCIDIGVGMNKAVSLGNQIDVSINELIEYMADDPDIKVIAVYVEDIKDGRGFLELLKKITPNKPVLVWKGGLTDVGSAAAMTHTGSMAGNADIFRAAMRQAGAILIDNLEQMIRALRLLKPPITLPGRRLGIICPGGGDTVSISDAFSSQPDLIVPRLTIESRARLQALLPEENVDTKNPVDPGAVGMTRLDRIIRIVGEDPGIDSILLMLTDEIPFHFDNEDARKMVAEMMSSMVAAVARDIGKPLFAHMMHVRDNNEEVFHCRSLMVDKLIEKGIPWSDGSFKESAQVFSKLAGYYKYLKETGS
jgi:acyl-CoA synthetase (NDP forming)